jgi:ABC-2 type transport system permease protein
MSTWRIAIVIARKELTAARRRRSVHLLVLLVAALLVTAAVTGAQRSRRIAAEREGYQALVRGQWESQPDRHPHRVAHFGSFAFRTFDAFGAFDFGVDSFAGWAVYQEAHRQNPANFGEAGHASSMLRLGQLSPAMVLETIVPLLVVFLGAAAVAGERDGGTLPLLRSQGAGGRALVLGKALGLLAVLGTVLVPATIAALVTFRFTAGAVHRADAGTRVVLLVLSHAFYLGLWSIVVVCLSARARTSRGALAAGVTLWVATVVILPRGAAALGATLHPAPARLEVEVEVAAEIARHADPHDPQDPRFVAVERELLARYGVTTRAALPINLGGAIMKASEEISAGIASGHLDRVAAIHDRQDRVTAWAGLFSPFVALRALSMALAGTGPADHWSFLREAERHRYDIVQRLNELHMYEIRPENDRAQRVSARHFREMPAFADRPLPLGASLRHGAWAAACLLAWATAAGLWLLLGASRERRG